MPGWMVRDMQPEFCTRCGETLDPRNSSYLELNQRTGLYQKPGTVPQAESQGSFPFGASCAASVLKAGGKLMRIRHAKR